MANNKMTTERLRGKQCIDLSKKAVNLMMSFFKFLFLEYNIFYIYY